MLFTCDLKFTAKGQICCCLLLGVKVNRRQKDQKTIALLQSTGFVTSLSLPLSLWIRRQRLQGRRWWWWCIKTFLRTTIIAPSSLHHPKSKVIEDRKRFEQKGCSSEKNKKKELFYDSRRTEYNTHHPEHECVSLTNKKKKTGVAFIGLT